MGSNRFGQLGVNDFKKHPGPVVVGGELVSKQVTSVACGDDFTVIATSGETKDQFILDEV